MQIRDHHQRAIHRLSDAYRDDPRFRALIVGGSVAKGCARADSDVDFLIVASDEEFEQHRTARDLFINRRDLCDYELGPDLAAVVSTSVGSEELIRLLREAFPIRKWPSLRQRWRAVKCDTELMT